MVPAASGPGVFPRLRAAVSYRGALPIAAVLAAVLLLPACGGRDNGDGAESPPPLARPEDFPKAAGKSLSELRKEYMAGGPVLAPAEERRRGPIRRATSR